MGYRVLYIQQSENLSLYLDNLKVKSEKGDFLFPIVDLQMLILDNYKMVLSVQLMNKLAKNNVSIVMCGIDHLPQSYVLPFNGYFAQSGMLFEQINWTDEMKLKLHQKIIQAKIINQREALIKNNKSKEACVKLFDFFTEVELGDRTNREGLAAKMYFREMYGKTFIRFNEDTINAGLNYGYSIFRSLITSLLVGKGLSPNLGLFHKGKTNHFNLSDDIIEVFRPIVDDYVLNHMMQETFLTNEHRKNLIKTTTYKIKYDGKYQTIHNAIDMYVESILKCIREDDISYFKAPFFDVVSNDDL